MVPPMFNLEDSGTAADLRTYFHLNPDVFIYLDDPSSVAWEILVLMFGKGSYGKMVTLPDEVAVAHATKRWIPYQLSFPFPGLWPRWL